ncbi:hypothetical protein H257_07723 [Aphanomyces astaci]|uniref:PCI domain-containing protein n=1 Tax=Aphanomyces astaci TaxID=112090 RepID=W4GJ23_APHAT|nr:hypothetical protein H257_07723 [Aphanomyces astaci]ETV78933.1 hypothetical protein H257_07723 [Aphanomyces astaci]RHY16789.1 hypothetical protein DYB25_004035 [Aphanomyces astaci]RHY20164.1 hypothetical protein DYB36_004801 [Aphanomyces astaci]RHY47746.1 hypothetical protein DYB34_002482 [Aphanomyces astaci]RHY55761.1 hypothetical protein DYB30_005919 [Aphanomyces astaci]|eukprot:XP_009831652.1 hypothetical protein H257_07723 [Aphanomyces astaci]
MSRSVNFNTSPSANATAVKAQVDVDALDQSLIALLEAYLDEQIATSVVDEEANMTLLKLYSIYSTPVDHQLPRAIQILAKGLTVLPSNFFLGASYLVSEPLRKNKDIAELLQAGSLLQTCLFPAFWQLPLASAKKIPGFDAAVREYIVSAIARSHDVVAAAFVAEQLHLGSKEVEALVTAHGWTVQGASFVVAANADNQMRPKKFKEDIAFTDLLDTINVLSR